MKLILLATVMIGTLFGATDHVGLNVEPSRIELKNGASASFNIRLRVGEGIHINARPPVTVESLTKDVELSISDLPKSGDYLDASRPIRISCRTQGLAPGVHRAEIVVGFTYCSDKEGWCRIGKDSTSVQIEIKK